MNPEVRVVLQMILDSHPQGTVTCSACLESLHTLWAMVEKGADLHDILPAMAEHFDCCPECREEYEAFICIMRAETSGQALECLNEDKRQVQAHEEPQKGL
jgi:hypothetical protein